MSGQERLFRLVDQGVYDCFQPGQCRAIGEDDFTQRRAANRAIAYGGRESGLHRGLGGAVPCQQGMDDGIGVVHGHAALA